MYRTEITAEQYEVRESLPHIASIMGDAAHAVSAELLRIKQTVGDIFSHDVATALQRCWPAYEEATSEEYLVDNLTEDRDVGWQQMDRIAWSFFPVLDTMQPSQIEQKFESVFSPLGEYAIPVRFSGTVDVREYNGELTDHKTGKEMPVADAQLGGYSLLCKDNGLPINSVRLSFVERVPLKKIQPAAVLLRLDVDACESEAWTIIKDIQRHYEDWRETKDPRSFPGNPNSQTCTQKFCPVWGTRFCTLGR